MQEAEFQNWIAAKGQPLNTQNTRISDARRLEVHYGDLDELYDKDGFDGLQDELRYSAEDQRAGRPNPAKFEINGDLVKNLIHYRSTLTTYAQFRSETDQAGDFSGADKRITLYDDNGTVHWPVQQTNRATGAKAFRIMGASNKTEDAIPTQDIVEVGRALFLEERLVRVVRSNNGRRPYLGYGKQKLTSYSIDPEIAKVLGIPPTGSVNGDGLVLDQAVLENLKAQFLAAYPDFLPDGFAGNETSFLDEVVNYKRSAVAKAQALWQAEPPLADVELGGALLDVLTGIDLPGWRANSRIAIIRKEKPGLLENAAAQLARSNAAYEVRAGQMSDEIWPALVEGQEQSKPYAESRNVPSMLLALLHPNDALGINTHPLGQIYRALTKTTLFGWNPLTSAEYGEVLRFSHALYEVLEGWGWQPQDLWDIQSFIWATSLERTSESDTMTDEQLLARFDGDEKFRVKRATWSEERAGAFCRMARAAHSYGLDWYHTNIPEIRFGRREKSAGRAEPTLGVVHLAGNALRFSHSSPEYSLSGTFAFDAEGADAFESALSAAADKLEASPKLKTSRKAYWPDDYAGEATVEIRDQGTSPMKPTNLILYGPPGTGKTYQTAKLAVELCDGVAPGEPEAIKSRYSALASAGQIGFVTFHQSYAYEDFVEGLRPQTGGDGEDGSGTGFRLDPKQGVFREIAALADHARRNAGRGKDYDFTGRQFFKMSLGRAGYEDHIYDAAIDGGYIVLGWGGEVDWSPKQFDDYQAVFAKWNEIEPGTSGNAGNISQVWRFRSSMREGDIVVISDGNLKFRAIGEIAGPYEYNPTGEGTYNHRRKVNWLLVLDESLPVDTILDGQFSQASCYMLRTSHVKLEALARLLPGPASSPNEQPDQFVLIIDEINRANISKVFGELITLIEPDKRLGEEHELTLKLPYSGDPFGVPNNLHIVGTMNTADRSIALLDTALRRRFNFRELMPDPGTLSEASERTGVDLGALLRTINERVEYLFDREHQIGHAYFIHCRSIADLHDVMRFRIIPLLAEYFYEDWSKVALVLGDADGAANFIKRTKLTPPTGMNSGGFEEERFRWEVCDTFADTAYASLT